MTKCYVTHTYNCFSPDEKCECYELDCIKGCKHIRAGECKHEKVRQAALFEHRRIEV